MRLVLGLLVVLLAAVPATAAAAPTDIDIWSGSYAASCGADAPHCPKIPVGKTSNDMVVANLSLNIVDEPFDDRFPDRGNVRVRFTPKVAYCSSVHLSFGGAKLNGAGDWQGGFTPASGGWWNAPASRTQELMMYMQPGRWRIPLAVWASPGCPTGSGRAAFAFKVEIAWVARGEQGPHIKLPGELTGAMRTRHAVGFSGNGWNRNGGPIIVRWGGKTVKRFAAARRFYGHLDLSRFPTQTPTSCAGTLTASQGPTTRSLPVKGIPGRYYYAAEGLQYGDGTKLRAGDVLCEGLAPKQTKSRVAVYKPLTGENPAVIIDDPPGKVQVSGVWFESMASRIDLAVGGGRRITIAPNEAIGPFLPGIAAREPTQPPHTVDTPGPITEPDPNILNNGTTLARQGIHFAVGLVLADAGSQFFVRGDLRVDKAIGGHGGLLSTGSISLAGPVKITDAMVLAARVLRLG